MPDQTLAAAPARYRALHDDPRKRPPRQPSNRDPGNGQGRPSSYTTAPAIPGETRKETREHTGLPTAAAGRTSSGRR